MIDDQDIDGRFLRVQFQAPLLFDRGEDGRSGRIGTGECAAVLRIPSSAASCRTYEKHHGRQCIQAIGRTVELRFEARFVDHGAAGEIGKHLGDDRPRQ